jgi:hypothetical protein
MAKGDKMRNVTIAETKANEGADKAILEIDEEVRESVAALYSGKVRPSPYKKLFLPNKNTVSHIPLFY